MTDRHPPRYSDSGDHLRDELVRLDLLLRRTLERWQSTELQHEHEMAGLFISDHEVDGLLLTESEAVAHVRDRAESTEATTGSLDQQLAELTSIIRDGAHRSVEDGVDLRLLQLQDAFALSDREVDVLLVALAPTIDDKYGRVYAYLRNDITATQPTVELIRRVLAEQHLEGLTMLARHGRLRSAGLLSVASEQPPGSQTVSVPERVASFILGSDALPTELAECCSVLHPSDAESQDGSVEIGVGPDIAVHRLDRSIDATSPRDYIDQPLFCGFVGEDQRAAERAIQQACGEDDVTLLRLDSTAVEPDRISEVLTSLEREARLRRAAVHLTDIDAFEAKKSSGFGAESDDSVPAPDRLIGVIRTLDDIPRNVFVSGDAAISPTVQAHLSNHRYVHHRYARPDTAQRRALWASIEDLPDDVDCARLASTYRFTTGDIEDAVRTARSLSPGGLTADAITDACRYHARGPLEDLATELTPTYDWDDIVLPADTHDHLRELAAAIRHRGTVFEEWGYGERFSLGHGINALFVGKSGTGKTMAAEVIANAVDLPIYKIDLAQIISKYVGETEKNLRRVFDSAADSNAILFFDEADAIFGERTEISDAHDRYANVEVDYLLQQLEEHDGCVILASNLKENIDDAFQRRLSATVTFPMPDADARADIWGSIFPDDCPVGDIDEGFLATFELSGGHIKNVALMAAFLAAEEDSPVEMAHIVRALRREFQKTGKLYDLDSFGPYQEVLT